MQVGESTLKTLVEGQKQFQVPLYQRQYAWDTAQLSQLWEDILEQYDLLTPESRAASRRVTIAFSGEHGACTIACDARSGCHTFLVIDGQQRLTSVLIALCALRDHAASGDPQETERFNELYLVNKYAKDLSLPAPAYPV